jgi:hypothetical protein
VVEDHDELDTSVPPDGDADVAFGLGDTLGARNDSSFVAAWPTAHTLACLRIAGFVTDPSQGSLPAGRAQPLAGRVSHPLDDKQSFMKSSHTPILLDQPCLAVSTQISHSESQARFGSLAELKMSLAHRGGSNLSHLPSVSFKKLSLTIKGV